MNNQIDPRHTARAIALQKLFTKLIAGKTPAPTASLLETLEIEEYDRDLEAKIVAGTSDFVQEADPIIQDLAPAWPIEQIAPVDLIILRMAIWEGFISRTTPAKVVINEAIELAREFGGKNSTSFVNGVLGTLLKNRDKYFTKEEDDTKPTAEGDAN